MAKATKKEQFEDVSGKFLDRKEQNTAKTLLKRYIEDYNLENISEQNTVKDVIYLEVIQQRLQQKMNDVHKDGIKAVPFEILELIHKNTEAIIKLKNTLGLNKAKQEKLRGYDAFEHYVNRHKVWREKNQASRTIKCPYCQKFYMLKMRTEAWEAQKHPFFMDTTIYNRHLFAHLGESVLVSPAFIAAVLETSPDYINWVLKKIKPEARGVNENSEKENSDLSGTSSPANIPV